MIITCEHASNDVKYTKLLPHEEELSRSHDYFDIGAADLANQLSEEMKCVAVLANYCKLFCDPSKPLVDSQIIRYHYKQLDEEGKLQMVSFNNQGFRLYERLESYYLEYHKILQEVMEYVEPELVINVHSHDADQVNSP